MGLFTSSQSTELYTYDLCTFVLHLKVDINIKGWRIIELSNLTTISQSFLISAARNVCRRKGRFGNTWSFTLLTPVLTLVNPAMYINMI